MAREEIVSHSDQFFFLLCGSSRTQPSLDPSQTSTRGGSSDRAAVKSRLPTSSFPSLCPASFFSSAFVSVFLSSCPVHFRTIPQAALLSGNVDMDATKKHNVTKHPEGDVKLPLPGVLPTQPSGFDSTGKGQPLVPHTAIGDPAGTKIPKGFRGAPVRNTVATREKQDPDRHCYRASGGGRKTMKCEECFDYNKGVAAKCCQVCGHTNSIFTGR